MGQVRTGLRCHYCCPPSQGCLIGALAQDAQPLCSSQLIPPPSLASRQAARHSLQAVGLGPCEIHVAAQGTMEVLQGFFCHLHLPLGHKDVLAREAAQSARVGHDLHQTQPTRGQGPAPVWPPTSLVPSDSFYHQGRCLDPVTSPLSCSMPFLLTLPSRLRPHCPRASFQKCRGGKQIPERSGDFCGATEQGPEPSTCLPGLGDEDWAKAGKGGWVCKAKARWVADPVNSFTS